MNTVSCAGISAGGATVYVTGEDSSSTTLTLAHGAATGTQLWQRDRPRGNGHAITADPNGSAIFVTGPFFAPPPGRTQGYITVACSA